MTVRDQTEHVRMWMSLNMLPQIGLLGLYKTADKLAIKVSDIPTVAPDELLACGWNQQQIRALRCTPEHCQRVVQWINASPRHHFICLNDAAYPDQLKHIAQAPLYLFASGDITLLSQKQLAVVGSRHASHSALAGLRDLLADLHQHTDIVITSGMALGIDAQAHKSCLSAGAKTIAVLGSGIDIPYPKRHNGLYQNIVKHGLVLSEHPPGTAPMAHHFPQRNRIISGLSLGTLVAEAAIKSGSLITAKYALEQGREVFAMPSTIQNRQAHGCHWLIKQGAKLVDSVQDLFNELPLYVRDKNVQTESHNNRKQSLATDSLLDSVDFNATSVDAIAKRSQQPVQVVLTRLLEYELRGLVISTVEGYIKVRD